VEQIIQQLSNNYRQELEQLQTQYVDESSAERIEHLKLTLNVMHSREKLCQDINETTKLSQGKQVKMINT
jgi:hypothetical protein